MPKKNMTNNEKEREDEKNKELCKDCTSCCEYVTIELADPKRRIDFEEIIWFIMHENVAVYIDNEDKWNVEFRTRCKALGEDGLCKVYDERTQICRDYKHENCERHGNPDFVKVMFRTREDVISWARKNTKVKI